MKQKADSRSALRWMGAVAGGSGLLIALLTVVQMLYGGSGVGYAMLLRELVNAAVSGSRNGFFRALLRFCALVIVQLALRAAVRALEERCRSTLENRFKQRLFSRLLTGDYAAVTATHSGEWMNRLTDDTTTVANGMTQILPGVSGMGVKLLGALIAILFLEPRFMLILLPCGAVLLLSATAFRKVMKRLHKAIREADGRLRVFLTERLSSMLIVRAFAQEKQTEVQAAALMAAHRTARLRRNRFSNLCNVGFGVVMNGLYVLGAAFCGWGILTGTVSFGNLTAVLQLISQIQSPFANITGYLPQYYAMLASAERLMEAERFPSEEPAAQCPDFTELGLRNATFTYQSPVDANTAAQTMPVVVSGFDLVLKRGEYMAFTGPSGCGKSTVLKLLMRLYPLDDGACYFRSDGREQPLTAAQRGLFAYVPQGNQLLSGTIREIITFGDTERMQQEEALRRALVISCADEFVSGLEHGLDTVLGERGAGLSEGQMQRIAIARAVFSDRPVLLLDEATSSLDEATEAKLLANLRAMTDKTVIIVTHRPAVLRICDKQIDFGGLSVTP